jgi:GDPmannose 4,6-dehydratase
LGIDDAVTVHRADLTDMALVKGILAYTKPNEIYHLAAQSSVGLSFSQPLETVESILNTTLVLLEALRSSGSSARVFNAGSTECYGNSSVPAAEGAPFKPASPYAVARSASLWAAASYREAYGMFVSSGILANHESPLRSSQFVTRKIVEGAVRIKMGSQEQLVLGNIDVRRDWGWAPEFVQAYWLMLQAQSPSDFNIATGETNSLSDFVKEVFAVLDLDWRDHVRCDDDLKRHSEILETSVDASRICNELGWKAQFKMRDVARLLVAREQDNGVGPMSWS